MSKEYEWSHGFMYGDQAASWIPGKAQCIRRDDGQWSWRVGMNFGIEASRCTAMDTCERMLEFDKELERRPALTPKEPT